MFSNLSQVIGLDEFLLALLTRHVYHSCKVVLMFLGFYSRPTNATYILSQIFLDKV
jgi:hypothetical protein